jgi:hypothetical protein
MIKFRVLHAIRAFFWKDRDTAKAFELGYPIYGGSVEYSYARAPINNTTDSVYQGIVVGNIGAQWCLVYMPDGYVHPQYGPIAAWCVNKRYTEEIV